MPTTPTFAHHVFSPLAATARRWSNLTKRAKQAAKGGVALRILLDGDVLGQHVPPSTLETLWDTVRTVTVLDGEGLPSADRHLKPTVEWLLFTRDPSRAVAVPEDVRRFIILGLEASTQDELEQHVPALILCGEDFCGRILHVSPLSEAVNLDLGRCDYHDREEVGWCEERGEEICVDCAADGGTGELSGGHWLDTLNGGIDWVVVSGGAAPCDVAWVRRIIQDCRKKRVPCWVEQLGAHVLDAPPGPTSRADAAVDALVAQSGGWQLLLRSRNGSNPEEWPEDVRVREEPRFTAD